MNIFTVDLSLELKKKEVVFDLVYICKTQLECVIWPKCLDQFLIYANFKIVYKFAKFLLQFPKFIFANCL